jgi:branched-subunit amino acid aminotransferase/4-amino-4-deoxychorismate lyase
MRIPTLIETVRVRGGAAPLWYLHLRRLAASCQALGVPFPGALEVPEGGADRVHRLEVGATGVRTSERPVGSTAPVRLVTVTVTHRPYPHKTTERAVFDRAQAEAAEAGADDAVLFTDGGFAAEGTIWSLFWWDGRRLCAPGLELGVLPGVARARIAELVGEPEPRQVRHAELVGRPLFVANAARGVVAVASFDGHPVPAHPETEALARRFWP